MDCRPKSFCALPGISARRMQTMFSAWFLNMVLILLSSLVSHAHSGRILNIYWNSSNAIFQRPAEDRVFTVYEGDNLSIKCPYYPDDTPVPSQLFEYYIIYKVNKQMYDLCIINDTQTPLTIARCDSPTQANQQLFAIFQFSASGFDFEYGQDHYLISTSGGHESNIDNMYHGACQEENMKVVIRSRFSAEHKTDPGISGGNNNPDSNSPLTQPTEAPTERTTSTTTRDDRLITTPRPATTTAPPTQPPTRSKPHGNGGSKGGSWIEEPIPGSDGFPDDDTIIHAGGKGGSGNPDSNINSGVIDDGGPENSSPSLHSVVNFDIYRRWALMACLVIPYLLTQMFAGR